MIMCNTASISEAPSLHVVKQDWIGRFDLRACSDEIQGILGSLIQFKYEG